LRRRSGARSPACAGVEIAIDGKLQHCARDAGDLQRLIEAAGAAAAPVQRHGQQAAGKRRGFGAHRGGEGRAEETQAREAIPVLAIADQGIDGIAVGERRDHTRERGRLAQAPAAQSRPRQGIAAGPAGRAAPGAVGEAPGAQPFIPGACCAAQKTQVH
jgi:hypothetical protein